MTEPRIRIYQNPWSQTVPNENLLTIFKSIAEKRAEHVAKQFEAGIYECSSFGLAFLDPTAPLWKPSPETLLATIAIGSDGEELIVNAIAKAMEHRDKGKLAGYGAYVDLTQTRDGDFTWGFSTQVDDSIVGGSGQTEIEDACEAGHAAVSFNYFIRTVRKKWLEASDEKPAWFCNANEPHEIYSRMANDLAPLFDSGVVGDKW